MTKEEFTDKFKVGDEIIFPDMDEGDFLTILYFGEERFFFSNEEIGEGASAYTVDKWTIYEEPKKTVLKWLWMIDNGQSNYFEPIFYTEEEMMKMHKKDSIKTEKIIIPRLSPIEVEE